MSLKVDNPPGFLQCACLNIKLWTITTKLGGFQHLNHFPFVSANKINCYCSKHQLLNLFFRQQFTSLIPFDEPIFVFVSSICTIPSTIHSLLSLAIPHCFQFFFVRHKETKGFKPVTLPGQEAAADYQVKWFEPLIYPSNRRQRCIGECIYCVNTAIIRTLAAVNEPWYHTFALGWLGEWKSDA